MANDALFNARKRDCGNCGYDMKVKLSDISTIQSGGTPSRGKKEYWENGTIPWVKISDFSGKLVTTTEENITELGLNSSSAKLFSKGTILYTIFATLGEVRILDIEAATNQAIAGIKINDDSVDRNYLYHFLVSLKEYVNNIGRGVAQNNINLSILRNLEVPLPSRACQRQIANTLDAIDKLIEQHQQELATLDELVKSRFVEMFGTEREFERWVCVTVGDVADVCVGVVIKPTQYYTEHGIPAFRSLNIRELRVKNSDWVYFTEEGHQKNQKSVIRKGDVLVVRSGAPGTACVATEEYEGYNAVDIIIAHPDNTKVNSTFLAAFTNMPHGMNQIRQKTGGAAQQHFNVGGYKGLNLILPPLPLQNQFADFVAAVDKSKSSAQKSLDELETLKKGLMQEYFG